MADLNAPHSPAISASPKNLEPIAKRGQCSVTHNGKLYLYGGYSQHMRLSSPTAQNRLLDVFDFTNYEWNSVNTQGDYPEAISGACSTVIGDCLYIFGGWCQGRRDAQVYQLDLSSLCWKRLTDLEMEGSPLCKDKAGMVDYGDQMLCVMGGYGHPQLFEFSVQKGASYHWDPNSSLELCWTNELHLFHVRTCM